MRAREIALLTLIACGMTAAFAAPKLLRATVEEPVLEELMGGCSLLCAFPWTVELELPGGKPQPIKLLNDETAMTAWVAPEPMTGIGTKFHLRFPKKLPAVMEGQTPLYGLDVVNGFVKNEELWRAHGRVKKLRIYYNGKPFRDVALADSTRWQRVQLPDIMVKSGDWMTLEILEIHPGTESSVAITEFVLQGAH